MLILLLGCSTPAPVVTATLQDTTVGNVVVVEWDSDADVAGTVSAGEANRTPSVVATHHRHTVWGLPPDELVTLSVEEEGAAVAEVTVQTIAVPTDVPQVTLEFGTWDGFVAIPYSTLDGAFAGALVVDGQGRTVAWARADRPNTTNAVWDGTALWYNEVNVPSALWRVPLDGGEATGFEVPDAHHEFVLLGEDVLPGGGVAYLRTVERVVGEENVYGDQLVFRGHDGSERVVWDAFATEVIPAPHEGWNTVPGGGDWTHANGIARDPVRGTWLVSLYWLQQVLEIDEATGQVVRRLDGAPGDVFGPQHAPEPTASGVLLFDNQKWGEHSRVAEIDWSGAVTWEWSPDPEVTTLVLGDVDRLPDGRTLTAWGTDGAVIGIDAAGDETFRVRLEELFVVGQAEWRASLYE